MLFAHKHGTTVAYKHGTTVVVDVFESASERHWADGLALMLCFTHTS